MSRKIQISVLELENLYLQEMKSTYGIGRIFECDATVIQKRLKKYGIPLRSPKKKIIVSKELLKKLYWEEELSTYKIAKKLNIGRTTIWSKLDGFGIPRRPLKRVPISKIKLTELYWGKKYSAEKIARLYDLSDSVVLDKLNKNNIRVRTTSEAGEIYPKKEFSENETEKAYMLGFRLGDLNCKRLSSTTVNVKSNTTKLAQLELMKKVYGVYGHCWIKNYDGTHHFNCALNNTFSFLVPKEDEVEEWILKNNEFFMSFFAGYVDAEGSIKIYDKRARFRVGSYDKNLLSQSFDKLKMLGINGTYKLETKANKKQRKDFWRIGISRKESLVKLFSLIEPYMKHGDRLSDLQKAKENVLQRLKRR